ncbi:hypothetical protein ACFLW1_01900 [Chloroflexota bacterium]
MDNHFTPIYQDKSDLELLLIAFNADSSYTQDASDAAKTVVSARYQTNDLEKVQKEIIERLMESAKGCNICHSPEVFKSCEVNLRKLVDVGTTSSGFGIALALATGAGFVTEKYAYQKMNFNLCKQCFDGHIDKKGRLKLSLIDYNQHPLFQLFRLLGYS